VKFYINIKLRSKVILEAFVFFSGITVSTTGERTVEKKKAN